MSVACFSNEVAICLICQKQCDTGAREDSNCRIHPFINSRPPIIRRFGKTCRKSRPQITFNESAGTQPFRIANPPLNNLYAER